MNKAKIITALMDSEKQYGLVDTLHRVFGKNIRVNLGFSKRVCDHAIEELDLSVRGYNALRRAGVITLGDLIELLNADLLKSVRNLGAKSISEIKTKITVFGFERLSEREKSDFFGYLVDNNTHIDLI